MFRTRGIALVLTVGILTLLTFAAASLVNLAVRMRAQTSLAADRVQARLLMRSGLDYADARLMQDPSAKDPRNPDDQPDDWTYRDGPGVPLEQSRNPSYARSGGAADAWSGRLRGSHGFQSGKFLLKINATGGQVDVNAGLLDARVFRTDSTSAHKDSAHRDVDRAYDDDANFGSKLPLEPAIKNVRIADTIDLLGQALSDAPAGAVTLPDLRPQPLPLVGPAPLPDRPGGVPGFSETPLMRAGDRIFQGRPLGGYISLEPVRSLFTPADWEKISPYLTLYPDQQASRATSYYRDPHVAPGRAPASSTLPDTWPESYTILTRYMPARIPPWAYPSVERVPAIHLPAAERPLLQALFTGLMGTTVQPQGEGLGWVVGLGFADAGRVADFLIANRPFASHYDLFVKLDAAKEILFPQDDPWSRITKANIVCANLHEDLNFVPDRIGASHARTSLAVSFPTFSWCSYDLPRWPGWPSGEDRAERIGVDFRWSAPLPVPAVLPSAGKPVWSNLIAATNIRTSRIGTLPLSLDPSETFTIRSLGRVRPPRDRILASAEGGMILRVTGVLAARSQADFELGRDKPHKDRIQSYPHFPLDSCTDLAGYPGVDPFTGRPMVSSYAYPKDFGTLALMATPATRSAPETASSSTSRAGRSASRCATPRSRPTQPPTSSTPSSRALPCRCSPRAPTAGRPPAAS